LSPSGREFSRPKPDGQIKFSERAKRWSEAEKRTFDKPERYLTVKTLGQFVVKRKLC